MHAFRQLDVFTDRLTLGNPLAVVHDAADLSDEQLGALASWTNLSETAFLLPPTDPRADYRVRIFTPARELPFAGHPTLGSAHAWLAAGGRPQDPDRIVQECGVGLVPLRRSGPRWGFAAPPLQRGGPVDPGLLADLTRWLGLGEEDVRDARWADNGPGWVALLLRDAETVLRVVPDRSIAAPVPDVGLVGAHAAGAEVDFEVRALTEDGPGSVTEDPVTGSLNAAIGQWLIGSGYAPSSYRAAQGTVLGRQGRVHVEADGDDVWVSGDVAEGVVGTLAL